MEKRFFTARIYGYDKTTIILKFYFFSVFSVSSVSPCELFYNLLLLKLALILCVALDKKFEDLFYLE